MTESVIDYSISFKPKPRRKAWNRTFHPCRKKAPCGGACVLNSNCKHEYHTCLDRECPHCHGVQRFRFGGQK